MRKLLAFLCLALWLAGCSGQPPTQSLIPDPTEISVNWSSLHLSGKLVFVHFRQQGNQLIELDLTNGKSKVLFQAPPKGVLSAAAISPDGAHIALTYSPPPPSGASFIFPTLFLLPGDGSGSPQALIPNVGPDDSYFNPAWAPDGQAIYSTQYHRGTGGTNPDRNLIVKISLDGKATQVLDNAVWPEISPDGKTMAYLTVDPKSGLNRLAAAAVDGSNSKDLLPGAPFPTVDAHRFTPDGQSILFSAANPTTSFQQSPLEKLLGIEVVDAHTLPSDIYKTMLSGGTYQRITNIHQSGLYPAISPDGQMLAFISQSGIYVAHLDGSGLQQLSTQLVIGTLDWLR